MELVVPTCEKIGEMFILILAGILSCKAGLLDEAMSKKLSNLLLMVVCPCLIINSYQIDYRPELFTGLVLCLLFSGISFALDVLVAHVVIRPDSGRDEAIERMGIIYSNCAFIGIPLVEGVLGKEGVFYVTAYLTVFNTLVWTHGVSLMRGKGTLRESLGHLNTPTIYAIGLGLLLFFSQIRLPALLAGPVASLSALNTPLAMLIAGVNLAGSDIWGSMKNPRIYWIGFVKLIIIPLVTLAMLILLRADRTAAFVVFICAACPTGAMTTLFALKYNRNARYASEAFCSTTIFSLVTMPVLTLLAGAVL